MSRICFVTYEVHPTTWGGCGVLLRHAAELLLRQGHEVVFLLDIPPHEFERFQTVDRLTFSNVERCRGYLVDALCEGFPWSREEIPNGFQWKAMRFSYALSNLVEREDFDYIEFFEYCGPAYYVLIRKLYGFGPDRAVLGVRLHNSLEIIDRHEATRRVDAERYLMYGLEHGAIELAEAVLAPTKTYYEEYYKDLYKLPAERVVISQSPRMSFPPVKRRPGGDSFHIVYYGRVHQFKGVEQLMRAAGLLLQHRPGLNCRFDLIGPESWDSPIGESYTSYLKSMVPPSLRDRFLFPGFLSHDQAAERLNDALFAVFPNWFESFCYALHEVYEAGVPVIVNDLPGFRDFFGHEKNALVYDGSTKGLVAAMERMLDDAPLRERLAKPYPVATEPLGGFYDAPKALSAVRGQASSGPENPRVLALVLSDSETDAERATLDCLAAQRGADVRVVALRRAAPHDAGMFIWLGSPWTACSPEGAAIAARDLETRAALLVLQSGDRLDPRWIEVCAPALFARPDMAFAGTWTKADGRLTPADVDVAPEAFPFWHGAERPRVLLRTEPGTLLVDLFDPNLGPLGEIGRLWKEVQGRGPGRLLPEPWIAVAARPPAPAEARQLSYLIARYGGPFARRLSLLAGVTQAELQAMRTAPAAPEAAPTPPPEASLSPAEIADRLNGRTLLKLAWAKFKQKARNQLRRNR